MYDKITSLVDTILSKKASHSSADTSPEEAKIDKLVYELYGLDEDEIAVVEGKSDGRFLSIMKD